MTTSTSSPHYVLTGGPCAGKTSTIEELARRGHPVLAESARLIIEEGLASGKSLDDIRGDGAHFAERVLVRQLAMEQAVPRAEVFFFDRSVVDCLAYYRLNDRGSDTALLDALRAVSYRTVFLLDLLDFKNDEARNETPEQAMILHGLIREAYVDQGWNIVEVPAMPVAQRADFILERIEVK